MTDLFVSEIFSSIQGEGLYLGCRQIFLRLCGCNLSCAYCDTEFAKASLFPCEMRPGSGFMTDRDNPLRSDEFLELVDSWLAALPGAHHSLSVTGGEPLCQAEALAGWLSAIRERLPVHLETNGTLADELELLLPAIDFISMDLKLASASGVATPWSEHRRFLQRAATRPCQIKAVVTDQTSLEEVEAAAALVAEVAASAPLILQPLTRDQSVAVDAATLFSLHAAASARHRDVRIIPQVHHFLKLL